MTDTEADEIFRLAVERFSETMERAQEAPPEHQGAYDIVAGHQLAELRAVAESNPDIQAGAIAVLEATRAAAESISFLQQQVDAGFLPEEQLPPPPHTDDELAVARTVLTLLGVDVDEPDETEATDTTTPTHPAAAEAETAVTALDRLGETYFGKKWVCQLDTLRFVIEVTDTEVKFPNGHRFEHVNPRSTSTSELLLVLMENAGEEISPSEVVDAGFQAHDVANPDVTPGAISQRFNKARNVVQDGMWFEIPNPEGKQPQHIQLFAQRARGKYKFLDAPMTEYDPETDLDVLVSTNEPEVDASDDLGGDGVGELGEEVHNRPPSEQGKQYTQADYVRAAIAELGNNFTMEQLFAQLNRRQFNETHDRTMRPLVEVVQGLVEELGLTITVDEETFVQTIQIIGAEHDGSDEPKRKFYGSPEVDYEAKTFRWISRRNNARTIAGVEFSALTVLLLNDQPLSLREIHQLLGAQTTEQAREVSDALKNGCMFHNGLIDKFKAADTKSGEAEWRITDKDREQLLAILDLERMQEMLSDVPWADQQTGKITDLNEVGYTDPTTGEFNPLSAVQARIYELLQTGEWIDLEAVKQHVYGAYVDPDTFTELRQQLNGFMDDLAKGGIVRRQSTQNGPSWVLL